MIRIQLPEAEADRLEQAFRQATDHRVRDRPRIILMAHRGRAHHQIATDLTVSTRSVRRRLNVYLEGGFEALRPKAPVDQVGPVGQRRRVGVTVGRRLN